MNTPIRYVMPALKHLSRLLVAGACTLALAHAAQTSNSDGKAVAPTVKPLHPNFVLIDAQGVSVLRSNAAVSPMKTCGQCHDTAYIAEHAFHADLGLKSFKAPEKGGWDASPGGFGRWDPLRYRYLSQSGDERLDLSTAGWLMANGSRIAGGGPASQARDGRPLRQLAPNARNPETSLLADDGTRRVWDWAESGTMEMNCFVCHIERPNHAARESTIRAGRFGDAATATLTGQGIVQAMATGKGWNWNRAAFSADGKLDSDKLAIQDPTNANCAACHGQAHPGGGLPLQVSSCDLDQPQTATTGQVISGQRIKLSGANLAGKAALSRSWDVHAERQLQCTDCHHSRNNPAHARGDLGSRPAHLRYDPRTLGIGEYLKKPDHDFARGPGARSRATPAAGDEMRRCENCHDAAVSHANWLPYVQSHMAALACESCHIPKQHAAAIQSYDWTVLTPESRAVTNCRGVQGPPGDVRTLVDGFTPTWLARKATTNGQTALAPYNMITSFFWIYDDASGHTRPVRLMDLQAAYFGDGVGDRRGYAAEILKAFDGNQDGRLDAAELRIDSSAKQAAVQARLQGLGLSNPRMDGQVQAYAINHGVARGQYAINDCRDCHGSASRVDQGMMLASFAPVTPRLVASANAMPNGDLLRASDGALRYQPVPARDDIYVFGASRIAWVDLLGIVAFLGTLVGVAGHGLIRYFAWSHRPAEVVHTHPIEMYDAYRRFWHWLQAISIVTLLVTGIVIHRPDLFSAISFPGMVTLHNVMAALLVVNAGLSLFYHLATERMREYLPKPQGFIHDSIRQIMYYVSGIFKGEPHPFEKTPDDRMNPVQKLTYFIILNALLPIQIVTGALMWGAEYWPEGAAMAGGLPFLAPVHTLAAWLFATFIVAHVYLTTTGPTPLENIRAMITGTEEVEDHVPGQHH